MGRGQTGAEDNLSAQQLDSAGRKQRSRPSLVPVAQVQGLAKLGQSTLGAEQGCITRKPKDGQSLEVPSCCSPVTAVPAAVSVGTALPTLTLSAATAAARLLPATAQRSATCPAAPGCAWWHRTQQSGGWGCRLQQWQQQGCNKTNTGATLQTAAKPTYARSTATWQHASATFPCPLGCTKMHSQVVAAGSIPWHEAQFRSS